MRTFSSITEFNRAMSCRIIRKLFSSLHSHENQRGTSRRRDPEPAELSFHCQPLSLERQPQTRFRQLEEKSRTASRIEMGNTRNKPLQDEIFSNRSMTLRSTRLSSTARTWASSESDRGNSNPSALSDRHQRENDSLLAIRGYCCSLIYQSRAVSFGVALPLLYKYMYIYIYMPWKIDEREREGEMQCLINSNLSASMAFSAFILYRAGKENQIFPSRRDLVNLPSFPYSWRIKRISSIYVKRKKKFADWQKAQGTWRDTANKFYKM